MSSLYCPNNHEFTLEDAPRKSVDASQDVCHGGHMVSSHARNVVDGVLQEPKGCWFCECRQYQEAANA